MKSLNIGLQLYSVRDYFEKDFEATLKEIARMGYECVEFAGLYDVNPNDIRKLCHELKIVPVSAHQGINLYGNNFGKMLVDYGEMGCKFVAVPWADISCMPGNENWERFSGELGRMAEVAKNLGMKVAYHNHDFELETRNGKYLLDMLYEAVSVDILQTELDLCWIAVAGLKPEEYLKKYKGRAEIVHIKDFYMADGTRKREQAGFEFRSVGSGMLDVDSALEAVSFAGTKWLIVEQDAPTPGKTAYECVAASIDFLKSRI